MKIISNKSHLLVTTCLSPCDNAIKKFYFIIILYDCSGTRDLEIGIFCIAPTRYHKPGKQPLNVRAEMMSLKRSQKMGLQVSRKTGKATIDQLAIW